MPGRIENRRCLICSYYKKYSDELSAYPIPLCHWCAGTTFSTMLKALVEEMLDQCKSVPLLDCAGNDLFRFLSDLGELAASHPHLQVVRDIISTLMMNVYGQNRITYFTLISRLPSHLRGRLVTTLAYLENLQLLDLVKSTDRDGYTVIDEVTLPAGSIFPKALTTIEASGTWEERREPNMLLSYILLQGIAETLELIESQGYLEVGQGVTRLYVVNGRVLVPKQFTAPLVFILGHWATEQDEFSEDNINQFMSLRGFNQRDRNRIMQFIAGVQVGLSHTIYRTERVPTGDGSYSFRFLLNPQYKLLRERLRTRARADRS